MSKVPHHGWQERGMVLAAQLCLNSFMVNSLFITSYSMTTFPVVIDLYPCLAHELHYLRVTGHSG